MAHHVTLQAQGVGQAHATGRADVPMSGLPNVDPRGGAWNSDEFPLDRDGKEIPFDEFGIDPESLAVDGAGNFWVGEEYGPSLLKFDPSEWFKKKVEKRRLSGKH